MKLGIKALAIPHCAPSGGLRFLYVEEVPFILSWLTRLVRRALLGQSRELSMFKQ